MMGSQSKSSTIWIARHAERIDSVDVNWNHYSQFSEDPPLSKKGVIEANQLAHKLYSYELRYIVASPFLRTVETAAVVAKMRGLSIKLEPGVCECLYPPLVNQQPIGLGGSRYGNAQPLIDNSYQGHDWPQYPENIESFSYRLLETAENLLEELGSATLIVTHGACVTALARLLLGKPIQILNNARPLLQMNLRESKWELVLNDGY